METYITRQPIIDREHKVAAYELLFQQDSSVLYNQTDCHVAAAIAEFFNEWDHAEFLEDKEAFLTFTPNLLQQNVPHIFDKNKLVMQIDDSVIVHPDGEKKIISYKQDGYRLAGIGFQFNPRFLNLLPQMDFLKIDFQSETEENIKNMMSLCKRYHIKSIAYNINSSAARDRALEMGADYFQGASVADMVRTKTSRMDHLQSNFFHLMSAITKEQPDLDEIAKLISIDVTLTFSLMKLVNSAYYALRNRVKDIKQALTVMGLAQLKHWIYLLSFNGDGGMQDELIKISFQRATLCQELAKESEPLHGMPSSDAYLLGMFSTLDVLLEVPMEAILKELTLSEELNEALLHHTGLYGQLLSLCIAYEKAEWVRMNECAKQLQIPEECISQKYIEAVDTVNRTWNELQESEQDS